MRTYQAVLGLAILFGMSPRCFGGDAIVTSDGPSPSTSAHTSNVQISDGPNTSRSIIVTTDGPAQLPYSYPLPIVVTDGPSKLPYDIQSRSNKVVVSDGPGTAQAVDSKASSHKTKVAQQPLPEAETSAIAPVSAFENMGAPAAATSVKSPETSRPLGLMGTHATSRKAPFYIYSDEQNSGNHFIPSGWMGDYRDIHLNASSRNNPHTGQTCIRIAYSAKGTQGNGWAGIYWQTPANNWGDKPGGYDLTGKRRLTFWARGEKGGEVIAEFKMGGIQGDNSDSTSASTGSIVLTKDWQKFTISLADLDLTHIIGGFCWTASRDANPDGITFYLDDIRYE